MSFVDLLVVLGCLRFAVGRSNASLERLHTVAVSLLSFWGDECVSKETVVIFLAGGAAFCARRGRAIPAKSEQFSWEFDPTKGYAGQDISACVSFLLAQPRCY